MKRQTNWIVGVSDGKVHEYKIGDVTYFVSAEFERSSQTNLRDRVQRTVVSNLIPLTPGQASDTIAAEYVFGCREGGLMQSKKKKEQSGLTALYCRLSRDDGAEGDSNSVANQKRLLQKYAKENSLGNTRFYVDEAVTGTRMDKRDDLNRLLRDCRKGKIDRIITKSVSRFARNTTELLTMVRGLKELGVSIYFEEQGIDTAAIDLEMILTFPGMAAQKESETISENMRWSYQKRMESGDFNCCKAAYGYELIDGQLYINEAEAVVIRRIFDLYLQGCGKQAIANQLNTDGIPRRYGYKTWHLNAIHYILNNERYMGDALLQKNYTTETLPFRKRRNRGEKPQYYVENSNPAIVSREVFQAAQALQQRKTAGGSAPKNRYPFSGVLRCPVCGHAYRRQVTNGTAFWLCSYKASGRSECASDRVPENMVKEAFMRMSGKLADNREELLGDLIRQLEKLQNRTSGSGERIYQLNRQIADVNAQNLVIAQLHSSGILNNAEYAAQSGELNRKVSELRSERRRILMEDEDNEVIESLRALDEIMADYAPTEDFDEDLFGQIVESITVVSKNALRFCLAGGLALTERI